MTDDELQQRIKYLVEHGGIWEDPVTDLRRELRAHRWALIAAGGLLLANLILR